MSDKQRDNPYASPQSTVYKANPVERSVASPRWIVSFAIVFGLVVGAVSSYVRPMISGGVHYEAIVSLFVLMPMFLVISLFVCLKTAQPMRSTAVVVVAAWFTYGIGWSLVAERMWDDMVGVCVGGAVVSLVVTLSLMFFLRRMRDRKDPA